MKNNFKTFEFYIKEYKKLYNILFCKKNIPKNIIILQQRIWEMIKVLDNEINMEKELRKIYSTFNYLKLPNYLYLKEVFRSLIDVAIYKYICDNEKTIFLALTTDLKLNDYINLKDVNRYIDDIIEKQKKFPKRVSIITDFSLANLQCGDVIYREDDFINYYDIKDGIINKKIITSYHKNPNYTPDILSEKKQLKRIKKQKEKWEVIDQQLEFPYYRKQEECLILPFNIEGEKFTKQLKKCMWSLKNKLIYEMSIDNCISISVFNMNKLNKILMILDEEISDIEKYSKIKFIENPNIIFEIIDKYYFKQKNEFSFLFNDQIFDPYLTPPYINGISIKELLKIIGGEIAVYIEVNIENLLNEIRGLGIKLYPKKEKVIDGAFRYNNKNYMLEINGNEIRLGISFIQRIVSEFYTTEMIKTFFSKYYISIINNLDEYKKNKQ